ncbi:hypothetical protein Bbelb_409960 [Branchiostoma belcheri]|nr:hypothetical protein Bbelb_409960 [Branchiostoma belcheri]
MTIWWADCIEEAADEQRHGIVRPQIGCPNELRSFVSPDDRGAHLLNVITGGDNEKTCGAGRRSDRRESVYDAWRTTFHKATHPSSRILMFPSVHHDEAGYEQSRCSSSFSLSSLILFPAEYVEREKGGYQAIYLSYGAMAACAARNQEVPGFES